MVLASFVGAADLAEAQVTIPNTFTNGEVADAGEVNANFSALANALDVTVPNSFANSGIADANQVNSNFTALKTAVDTFTNDMAAMTSALDTAFSNGSANGYVYGIESVDITSDNAAVAATAAAAVDITTDNQAVCEAAGGTWEAVTSTCTAASNYNCFVGGFCAQAAIRYPPGQHGYVNAYDGHTQETEPALSAGCNDLTSTKSSLWNNGQFANDGYLFARTVPDDFFLHEMASYDEFCQ
jgi:hypothetical protein